MERTEKRRHSIAHIIIIIITIAVNLYGYYVLDMPSSKVQHPIIFRRYHEQGGAQLYYQREDSQGFLAGNDTLISYHYYVVDSILQIWETPIERDQRLLRVNIVLNGVNIDKWACAKIVRNGVIL